MVGISPVISWAGELEDAQEAVRQNPNDAVAHFNLGSAHGKLGQHRDALASFKEVVRINPNDAVAHFNLGSAHGKL
ncbi:uncharacterized protein METZ01_LOCUS500084, partial [marine metagenome]